MGQPTWQPDQQGGDQHQATQPQAPTKRRKWPWIAGGAVLLIVIIAALSDNGSDEDKKATDSNSDTGRVPESAPEAAPPDKPTGPADVIDTEGTFLVGTDIVPGTYRAAGGGNCYWERDKDLTGGLDSILDNGGVRGGQQVVTIEASDGAFKTHGCGTWTLAR